MAAESRDTITPVSETVAKRGRPPGEVTPESLLRSELIAHIKLYKRTREIVESRLNNSDLIDPDELAKYMDLLRRGISDLSKPFVAAAKPETAKQVEEEDGEKILARLLEGK